MPANTPGAWLISLMQDLPGQPERYRGDVGHEHQYDKHHRIERPDLAHHLLDRDLADRAADEQDRSDRRMAQADAEIEQHDHAEMHGVDAEVLHHRQQDWRRDQDGGRHVDQGAEKKQEHVDEQQDDVFVAGDGQEEGRHLGRHLGQGHDVADAGGAGDQGHDHRDRAQGPVQEYGQVAPAIVAIDEHGDEERPDAGDRAGLDGGEDAAQDAAEDDHQRDQAPGRIDRDTNRVLDRHHLPLRMALAVSDHDTEDDQREPEQQSGENACHEQGADR